MKITPEYILIYLLAINLMAFTGFYMDKRASRYSTWRIPEASLLVLTFLGGTLGAILARNIFRHKTKKTSFRAKFFFVVAAQIFVVIYLLMNYFGIRL